MPRTRRPYPLGKYRLRAPKDADSNNCYPVDIQYVWCKQTIRKTANFSARPMDWDPRLNNGRGGVRASFGPEARRVNAKLNSRLDAIENRLEEYEADHPNQITPDVIEAFMTNQPLLEKGITVNQDFVEFVNKRLKAEYDRNRIGRSRYQNGLSGMNIFRQFLLMTDRGTYKADGIYLDQISIPIIEAYIEWRRNVKHNSDHTINHALTPMLKACAYAADLRLLDPMLNARIQDLRITPKVTLAEDEGSIDRTLTKDEFEKVIDYHSRCKPIRRKDYLEMFIFAFHACGLRVVDVMTLQWRDIDFKKKELHKIMIKTGKRHIIPLTQPAINILERWKERREDKRFVFDLVKENLDLDDDEALYTNRNNATKCINQSLVVVGEHLGFDFNLTMHVARHTFAVLALNKGLSMSVVSRLLGHGSTDVTEKVYAKYLPETLAGEMNRLRGDLEDLAI